MKEKILAALMAALTAMSVSACAHKSDNNMMEKKKVLVVYFSATGTTASAAQILAKQPMAHSAKSYRKKLTRPPTSTGTTSSRAVRWKWPMPTPAQPLNL